MYKLVFLRHGESVWNLENRFTGWTNTDLSEREYAEAKEAAKVLKEGGYTFDIAYTSVLKRAIQTLWIDEIPDLNIPTGIPLVYELDDKLRPTKALSPVGPGGSKESHTICRKPGEGWIMICLKNEVN